MKQPAPKLAFIALSLAWLDCHAGTNVTDDTAMVSFRVRVCEGTRFEPLVNEDVAARELECTKPVPDVPLGLAQGTRESPLAYTDADGWTLVGPLGIERVLDFRLTMGSTTHACMTLRGLRIEKGNVHEGENTLLVFAIRKPAADKAHDEGSPP